ALLSSSSAEEYVGLSQQGLWQLTGLCLGQLQTSVPCQPRTGWTAATPRSPPRSATTGAAALTPGSLECLGVSSPCRKQNAPSEAPPAAPGWGMRGSEHPCPAVIAAGRCSSQLFCPFAPGKRFC
ncbi:TFF3 isoform 2, partial [Pan troglodytes]